MKKSKSVYVNPVQDKFLQATQQDKTFVGGRGVGKSSLIGFSSYLSVNHLPRAKQFFVSTTYNQILTKTMPAIEAMWQSLFQFQIGTIDRKEILDELKSAVTFQFQIGTIDRYESFYNRNDQTRFNSR